MLGVDASAASLACYQNEDFAVRGGCCWCMEEVETPNRLLVDTLVLELGDIRCVRYHLLVQREVAEVDI